VGSSTLHCSSEFHLARLKSKLAPLVYSLALRLSKCNDVFFASLENLTDYFGVGYSTTWRAVRELVDFGWFELISDEPFHHSTYRVIKHEEWAKQYPGMCREKTEWTGDRDELGVELHAASGGRVRFFPGHLKALRATGLAHEAIVAQWKAFLDADMTFGTGWRTVFYRFLKLLRESGDGEREPVLASGELDDPF
jgi:hypothetical protein